MELAAVLDHSAQHSWLVMEKPRAGEVRELNESSWRLQIPNRGRIKMWRVYHRIGGWESGGWRGGTLGRVEGHSCAGHKFSAACGLRRAVTMKWTEFAGLQPRGSAPVASPPPLRL